MRPDSLLAVIVVTDENEEVANPLAVGGQGWAFENANFPGNLTNNTAPQGTIECKNLDPNNVLTTGPNDPNCTSCAFIMGSPNFATRCPKDGTSAAPGYLDPTNDQINVRFFDQKQRFGVFAGYPTSRYVRGLTKRTVPSRTHEVNSAGDYLGDQDMYADCVNPIFATNLPTDSSNPTALCQLKAGPRKASDVYYAAIAGVPHQLLQAQPGDMECPAGTNAVDCPQKSKLTDADWTLITGRDPEHYDFRGIDFHMLESTGERTSKGGMANASRCPSTAADNCDPINGREWNTGKVGSPVRLHLQARHAEGLQLQDVPGRLRLRHDEHERRYAALQHGRNGAGWTRDDADLWQGVPVGARDDHRPRHEGPRHRLEPLPHSRDGQRHERSAVRLSACRHGHHRSPQGLARARSACRKS